jgi:hypothetical protein
MSQEYILALVVVLASLLKIFGIQIENKVLEGLLTGIVALWIAARRYRRGDITIGGFRRLGR